MEMIRKCKNKNSLKIIFLNKTKHKKKILHTDNLFKGCFIKLIIK